MSSALLQLLHMDLAGPFCTFTPEVGRCLLLNLDDYSKYGWVRVMCNKSDKMRSCNSLCAAASDS
jgi:hypothetical protein